jgi:limonene-1,2-epoxide hydrolase
MVISSINVALAFVSAINAADLTKLRELMTEDHTFTDAKGNTFSGSDKMIAGWRYFFEAYPDYEINVGHHFATRDEAALFGEATGKWRVDSLVLPESWKVPAAWFAEIKGDKIKRWQVYCDTSWATPPGQS